MEDAFSSGSRGRLLLLVDRRARGSGEQVLTRYAPRLLAAGFQVRIGLLTERGGGNPLEARLADHGVAVDVMPFRRLFDPAAGWHLLHHVRQLRPDLIHTQQLWAHVWGTIAARLQRVPALATLQWLDDLERDGAAGPQRLANQLLNRGAARIICASETVRQRYQTLAGPPAAKLLTLHEGIELEAYPSLPARHRDTIRASLGIPAAAPLAITVAVLRPEKGVDLMLAALALLQPRWPDLHYLVVGDGEERAALEAETERLGLAARVRFSGWRTDVPRLLGCADLFVLPNREYGPQTVLAEAMAAGLPVVASPASSGSEMIENGGSGLLVPAGDVAALATACDELIASKRLRRAMGARGRQLAGERFAIGVQVERLARLYDQLIAAQGR